ncbi:hypothetical protein C1Y08_23235 [Pseudomonas sp. FW306-02-F02-AA]|uniref:Uncharacterized protein n=1 Tax=Pseudomonas fluorescens TaxID=294 RepID=A0A0N9W4Q3_PSEFL|nr:MULTISPECIES: hypothetical protein [Pseudomonas]ALI01323.1 hypothetical protein AO353_09675 [Pseudomonas fluorescens]PMZ01953.1 hypothetical protein C1Y07_22815 [Pseudomonas sp. FW306-02-F02-AB]PMZ07755.1 hypothetical protein C1Y06_23295 [Pseudomonas sp. FW306-02-H06C]PMZ13601.1 hypothetical protein C1Y08_23235 [Pseudomonas sp. FW306-02-F02-AA]PMZ19599.1 hypothetical protein C1Y09_22890 [Pseudomonas sp. FW306-02-F08-AA]
MEQLEDDYPGDAEWQVLVQLYEEDYLDDARTLAKRLDGNLDMAVILYGKRGLKEGLWWIEQQVPALDNIRPADCLKDPKLIKRLRTALMRMP